MSIGHVRSGPSAALVGGVRQIRKRVGRSCTTTRRTARCVTVCSHTLRTIAITPSNSRRTPYDEPVPEVKRADSAGQLGRRIGGDVVFIAGPRTLAADSVPDETATDGYVEAQLEANHFPGVAIGVSDRASLAHAGLWARRARPDCDPSVAHADCCNRSVAQSNPCGYRAAAT
jgi:hypothetical protein